jgi:class 3 adenylate cyclase
VIRTELILALCSVDGATRACAARGDEAMVDELQRHYSLIADAVRAAGGRVVKVIGDGVLVVLPPSRPQQAVAVLRRIQEDGTRLWQAFDSRCTLTVRAEIGEVVEGLLGPPGDERPDVYGEAVNRLFGMSGGDGVNLSAALAERAESAAPG